MLFDVEILPTHGGSLRIYGRHAEDPTKPVTAAVQSIKAAESCRRDGATRDAYASFSEQVKETKRRHPGVLDRRPAGRQAGRRATVLRARGTRCSIIAGSAPTSSTTRWTEIRTSRASSCRALTSRSHAPEKIRETRPDYVLILPWNLKDEIMGQLAYIREWGGRFVVPIPEIRGPSMEVAARCR